MLSKKGDVNWFIVSFIIIIVSLVAIVMIFLRLNPGADTNRVACTQSAVVRASLPDTADLKNLVPLSCKTKRICVTANSSKGSCEKEFGSEYDTFRLTGDKSAMSNQIKMVLAREMADCWNMLGEGNLQIFLREISSNSINGKVVVCSRVMFDSSVTKVIPNVSGMNSYLLSHKVPGKEISYWDYFRNANDGDTLQMLNGPAIVGQVLNDTLYLNNQKAIFYLESSVSKMGAAIGAVVGGAASAVLLGSFGGAGLKRSAFLGRAGGVATGVGGTVGAVMGPIVAVGAGSLVGADVGDKLQKQYTGMSMNSVAGVFMTDYSVKGFEPFEAQKIEFENIP